MKLNSKHGAILALIIANIIWGAASPIFKWTLENINPFTLAFLRFALGSLILFPFVYKYLALKREDIISMLGVAIFGVTINISLFFLALEYTKSINAPLIGSAAPLFVVLYCILFLHEKVRVKTIAGALLGLLGVLLVILQPILETGIDGSLLGNMLLVGATLSGMIHLFVAKKASTKYPPITVTFYSFAIGSLTFLPFFLFETASYGLPTFDMPLLIGVLYGAVLASALAHYLYYGAMRFLQPSEVSLFAYVPPVVAVLVALPLLGETLNTMYLLGGALVFLGLYIAEAHVHSHPFHHKT